MGRVPVRDHSFYERSPKPALSGVFRPQLKLNFLMYYVYAKRTDTDCFITVEDSNGDKRYARMVLIVDERPIMFADPIKRDDGTEFRNAGVYLLCSGVTIMSPCD